VCVPDEKRELSLRYTPRPRRIEPFRTDTLNGQTAMPQQTPPDIGQMTARMAANQAKVSKLIEQLDKSLDDLVAATVRRDWTAVRQLSGDLADGGRKNGYRSISALAQRVCEESERPDNEIEVKRSMIRLIGTCSRAKRPRAAAH